MRKLILLFLVLIPFTLCGQKEILNQMSGKDVRDAINDNFDSLYNYNKSFINVKDFGAVGDGSTDDHTAFVSAVAAATDSDREILIPSGHYIINGVIESTFTTAFKMRGVGAVKLDFSNYPPPESNSDYFDIDFDTISLGSILYDLSVGDRTVYIATDSLSINDYFYLRDTDDWIAGFCDKGEIVQVKEVTNDTTVEIYEALFDSYTASTTTAHKTSSGRSYIKNIEMIAPTFFHPDSNRVRFVNLSGFNNLTVEDVTINNAVYFNLAIEFGRNITINNYNSVRSLRTGFGYDLEVGASQDITITNCKLKGARHGFTTGGYFPVRMLNISDCIFGAADGWPHALDTHHGAEHVLFDNNLIYGGIQIRSPNTKITNNHIIMDDNTATIGIFYSIVHAGQEGDYFIAENNTIERISSGESGVGIDIYFQQNSDTLRDVILSNNIIKNVSNGIFVSGVATSGSTYIERLQLLNNSVNCTGGGYPLTVGSDINVGYMKISGGIYHDESASSLAFLTENKKIESLEIRNANFKATTSAIYLNADDIDNLTISGSTFDLNANSSNGSILLRNTAMAVIYDNHFYNTGKTMDIRNNDTVYVYNNNFSLNGDSIYVSNSIVYYTPRNSKIVEQPVSASLTDGAPTAAEISAAFGTTPALVGAGWRRTII
jgi:hypothetical protein